MKHIEAMVERQCRAAYDDLCDAIEEDDVAFEYEFELLDGIAVIIYDGELRVEIAHDDVKKHHDDTNIIALIMAYLPNVDDVRRWKAQRDSFEHRNDDAYWRGLRAPW